MCLHAPRIIIGRQGNHMANISRDILTSLNQVEGRDSALSPGPMECCGPSPALARSHKACKFKAPLRVLLSVRIDSSGRYPRNEM
jgi:hypothetical protein